MKKIFKNGNNQIRSGWKIGCVFLLFYITTYVCTYIFQRVYDKVILSMNPEFLTDSNKYMSFLDAQYSNMSSFTMVSLMLIQCICMILCVILFWKIWDKRKFKEMGVTNIKANWRDLCIGLLVGAVSVTIVTIILLATKTVRLQNNLNQPNFSIELILSLIVFIFVGINEELFSRGYCMTVLKQTKKSWIPLLGSAIIFSLMHSLNPGINLMGYINIFLVGIFLGYIFIKTKNIWMCIGYHITWNYFQGNVFGFLVSGLDTNSIYTIETLDPNIINGGNFGPEGGLVVTILLIISIFITYKFLPSRQA